MTSPPLLRPLTGPSYTALARARHAPLTQRPDGRRLPHPATLRSLTDRGLLAATSPQGLLVWTITPAGRQALTHQPPRLLHRRSERGYTSDTNQAMPREPEAVEPEILARFAEVGRQHHQLRHAHQPLAHRVAAVEATVAASGRGNRQLQNLRSALAAAERATR